MFGFFRSKDPARVIGAKKKVKIGGASFIIKKVDVLNYVEGAKVLQQTFDVYASGKTQDPGANVSIKKMKEHYTDVITSGVVSPRISRKPDDGEIFMDDLFCNWDILNGLYEAIISFSYGKKKLRSSGLRARSFSNST